MRCVIFDLDGTLANTSGDLIAAANVALDTMGIAARLIPGRDDTTALRGGRAMLRLAADRAGLADAAGAAMVDQGYPLLLSAYGEAIDHHTVLYEGVKPALARLRARGITLGVCTNKPEELADQLLRRLGVRDTFATLIGADTLPTRKPDPAPLWAAIDRAGGNRARACLIGDTITDRDTAHACGIPAVLVTFGPMGADVATLAPDATLDHYDMLDDVVDRIIPNT